MELNNLLNLNKLILIILFYFNYYLYIELKSNVSKGKDSMTTNTHQFDNLTIHKKYIYS